MAFGLQDPPWFHAGAGAAERVTFILVTEDTGGRRWVAEFGAGTAPLRTRVEPAPASVLPWAPAPRLGEIDR